MSTFLADILKKGYTEDEVFGVLFESERERKRRRLKATVIETADAHYLKTMNELLTYQELVIWRRENGFNQVADGEDDWFHGPRSLPPTPEQFTQSLWSEVNALKDAISMPSQKVSKLINAIEQGKLSDEEYAILKRLVEKRDRQAAQVTAVTRDDTVQHYCSPCSPNPEPSPDTCGNLENKGRIDPELEELKSSSAGTGLETPGQQCPPYEGIWEQGRTITNGILTAGVDSTAATPKNRRLKTFSEQNKQFDPGWRREKAQPWNAAVALLYFSGESGEAPCLCFVLCTCVPVFPNY